MRTSLLVVVLLGGLLGALSPVARAQTYRLTSWEGQSRQVSLSYKPFSKRLAISCAGDTLFLRNYQGTASVRVLRQRFLQITYDTRCGSNCATQNTVLLTLRRHHFQVPLLVLSANEWEDFSPTSPRARRYAVTLTMPTGSAKSYSLQARVHDAYKAAREPGKTHAFDRRATLQFDSAHHVFYSAWESVTRCLPVFREEIAPGTLSALPFIQPYVTAPDFPTVPLCVAGTFPVVRLSGQVYYFIQGKWYEGPEKQEAGALYWFTTDAVEYVPNRVKQPH